MLELEDIKCNFARDIYEKMLEDLYGIEGCRFEGYQSIESMLLDVDLLESKQAC